MRLPLSRHAASGNSEPAVRSYTQAAVPSGRTPWRQAPWCALDFEMTGLDPTQDEIISFGAVPIEGGRLQLRTAVTALARPSREISEASIPVHGIRDVDLTAAPPLAAGIGPLIEAIAGRVLVFHSAAIDRPFLRQALRQKGMRLRNPFVDTEVLGRLWLYERDGRLHGRLALADLAAASGWRVRPGPGRGGGDARDGKDSGRQLSRPLPSPGG